jgi:hypothetical protein
MMAFTNLFRGFNLKWLIWLLAVPIFLIRLSFPSPVIVNDSLLYFKLSENLIVNHCYSHSEVESAECNPYGGAKAPGYPVFLVLIKLIIGKGLSQEDFAQKVITIQTAIFALACVAVVKASYSWNKSKAALLISSFLLIFSPIQIAWSRWILTETLSAATGLFVFALLIKSLDDSSLKVIKLGLAISISVFIRWDQIWLIVPTALVALYLNGFIKGIKNTAVISMISIFPIIIMIIRAMNVGLPLLPKIANDPEDPIGVWDFFKAAALTQEATSGFWWPLWVRDYEGVAERFNYASIIDSYNTDEFHYLLENISALPNGSPLPPKINNELMELSLSGKGSRLDSLKYILIRGMRMWAGKDTIFYSGWSGISYAAKIENYTSIYKIAMLFSLFLVIVFSRGKYLMLGISLLALIALRSIFFASQTLLEIRYLMPLIPLVEVVLPFLAF